MGRYAMIVTATGAVDNVIEYDGSSPFTPPSGIELRVATNDAEPGGTWNGSAFVRAVVPEVPADVARTVALMGEVKTITKYNEDGDEVDKTAEEIAAEKTELLALLHKKLATEDLSADQSQTMLRLERE